MKPYQTIFKLIFQQKQLKENFPILLDITSDKTASIEEGIVEFKVPFHATEQEALIGLYEKTRFLGA